jgi:CDP-diacylglycerol---glycerol-3-phosphate 3-phosphatidyltransferase
MFPLNLPNALTLLRILAVPVVVVALLGETPNGDALAAAVFALAAATDGLDGYFARSRDAVTTFGKLMDPLADKLLITAALVSLVQMDLAPAWMVAVILGREFAVTVLRSIAHGKGVVIAASPLGKFKMLSAVVAPLALILGQEHLQRFYVIGMIALWIAMLTATVSGIDSYRKFARSGLT